MAATADYELFSDEKSERLIVVHLLFILKLKI